VVRHDVEHDAEAVVVRGLHQRGERVVAAERGS
jgi:hypothetical protein